MIIERSFIFRVLYVLISMLGLFLISLSLFTRQAEASSHIPDTIPPGVMPGYVEDYLLDCGGTSLGAAQIGWISINGDPDSQSITVPFGTATVNLQYHAAGIVCNSAVLFGLNNTNNRVISTNPSTSLVGDTVRYYYGTSTGSYSVGSSGAFGFSPVGGFTSSGTYTLTIQDKRINTFGSSNYQCVTNPADTNFYSPTSDTDFGACASIGGGNYTFYVNVLPPPPDAECSISFGAGTSLISDNRYIEPGALFNATVNVENTGGVPIADADGFEIREIAAGVEWNPLSPNNGNNRVPIPSGGIGVDDDADIIFTATAPDIAVANPTARTFEWQVYGNGSPVGDSCSATLYIAERYDIQPPTGVSSLSYVQPNQPFDWAYTYTFENAGEGASRNGPSFSDDGVVDLRFRYLVDGSVVSGVPTPTVSGSPIDDVTISGNSDRSWSYTANVPNTTLSEIGNELCVQGRARFRHGWEGGPITATGTTPGTDNYRWTDWGEIACVKAAEQAYIEVENGSVWSGGSFDASPTGFGTDWCVVAKPGGGAINTVRSNGVGAWADYVVGAVERIDNFGSAHIRAGQIDGDDLTFANRNASGPTLGNFGQGRCIGDMTKYLVSDTSRDDIESLTTGTAWPSANGQWVRTGNLEIGAQTIAAGDKYTIIVDGDVTINGNLRFSYNVNDRAQIPSLIIVATGDINIDSSVTQIDGFFFAKGTIDTCSDGGARLSNLVCQNKLRVNGIFAANDIEFRRTHGGVSGANSFGGNAEAELFVFSSEFYLADHILISEYQTPLPILFQQDLPPVI